MRQAITDANSMGGGAINFDIPGGGVQTISPLTVLPSITEAVTIDGYTQSGSTANTNPPTMGINAVLLIELSGALAPPGSNFSGLTINADNCTVRGLVIDSFQHDALDVSSNGNVIAGNFIGTNPAGTAALPNGSQGVGAVIIGGTASNNTVGGTTPDARNLVSGNVGEGVFIQLGTGNTVQGNLIGTDVTGTLALGNTDRGVVTTGVNTLIGGTTVDARNVISANNRGVDLNGGSSSTVQGNFIGTDVTGTIAISNPNAGVNVNSVSDNVIGGLAATAGAPPGNLISGNADNYGVILGGGVSNFVQGNIIGADVTGTQSLGNLGGIMISGPGNTVGGTTAGAGNIIAFNGTMCASPNDIGVAITGDASINNAILGNSIFSNGGLGIDLAGDDTGPCGETPNDDCDTDAGPNDLQNYPVITSATLGGGNVMISGTLNSVASSAFRLEFFSSPVCHSSGFGQGKNFLGSTAVTTNANCSATFGLLTLPLPTGDTVVSATATRLGSPSQAGCVLPPPNMVDWWPGDGNPNDIIGGSNGTWQGTETYAAGEVAQAFSFDGSSAVFFAGSGNSNFVMGTNDFTIDAWINTSATAQQFIFTFGYEAGFSGQANVTLYIDATNHSANFFVRDGPGNSVTATSTTTVNDGAWHHLAGSRQGTSALIYVDGVLEDTETNASLGSIDTNCNTAFIGAGNSQSVCPNIAVENFFIGLIDEVELFKGRALSQSEVQSLFNAGSAGKCKSVETSEFSQCVAVNTHHVRATPTPRSRPTPSARPTPPPHLTPPPPPATTTPTVAPRPTPPPHLTPVPPPPSPRPTPVPRPSP